MKTFMAQKVIKHLLSKDPLQSTDLQSHLESAILVVTRFVEMTMNCLGFTTRQFGIWVWLTSMSALLSFHYKAF